LSQIQYDVIPQIVDSYSAVDWSHNAVRFQNTKTERVHNLGIFFQKEIKLTHMVRKCSYVKDKNE